MEDKSTSVGVDKGGVGVHTGKPGKQTNVGVGKAASQPAQDARESPCTSFLHGKGPQKGHKDDPALPMKHHFLARQVAKEISFSYEKMPSIMNYFSVKPDSKEAEIMKKAVKECK
ncbi:BURP domain-containing protein [Actinidia rufa]|uniref:BURP domain-containing protein n=1 Tax=Actinidia rufa TaxID=165716 RepID=A0A7J0DHL7_9ERIC|nr:BURP domain-containing protein [Actinidia rufa]